MGRLLTYAVVVLTVQLACSGAAEGQTMTVSGNPQALVISTAAAGMGPDPVEDQGTTYTLSGGTAMRIEGHIDAPLPAGVALWVRLEPPTGAAGSGWVQMSTTPQVLVNAILPGVYSALGISYRLTATVQAGVVSLDSRVVTFTAKAAL